MVTYSQYIKSHRRTKTFRSSTPHFEGSPFKYGTCVRVGKVKPKKPNSAQRSIVKVHLSNERYLIAYVPGFGHNLVKNSEVMVRGGRVPDMPGCRYHVLRHKKDLTATEEVHRTQRRSKYSKKSPITSTKLKRRSIRKAKRRELLKTGFVIEDNILQMRLSKLKNILKVE